MKDEILYEPVGEPDYQRIVKSLESELARLQGELLPTLPASPIERDKQHMVWLELDRVSRHLAAMRDKAATNNKPVTTIYIR